MKVRLFIILAALLLSACTASGAPAATGGPVGAPSAAEAVASQAPAISSNAAPAAAGLPVDPSITPISIKNHSADAEKAFVACSLAQYGYESVAGMGLIPSAADLPKYAPFTGKEPQLQLPGPVWLVQFKGDIPMPKSGETWVDPVCIRADGDQGYFAVNGVKDANGKFIAPLPAETAPTLSLPALQP